MCDPGSPCDLSKQCGDYIIDTLSCDKFREPNNASDIFAHLIPSCVDGVDGIDETNIEKVKSWLGEHGHRYDDMTSICYR